MIQFRQGDVLIRSVTSIPASAHPKARDQGRVVLAYGEVTGHAHAIDDALAEMFEKKDGTLYLKAGGDVALRHEEHATITLPQGVYEIVHQREYSPEEIRRVAD